MTKRRPNRLLTDALREIWNTRSRFFSLAILAALAVSFLSGLRVAAPMMKASAEAYFQAQSLMDLRVVSTLGLTEEDVELLAHRPAVAAARGAYATDALLSAGEGEYLVKLLSVSAAPGLNDPRLLEGRMPQTPWECLAERELLFQAGLSLGDRIRLDTGTGNYEDALAGEEFTIVGVAQSPLYIGVERGASSLGAGRVIGFLLVPEEAFALDYYTDAYLRLEGTGELSAYSDAYEALVDGFVDELEPWAEKRAALRGQEVLGEARDLLAEAEVELNDARREVDEELSDARRELQDARTQLDDGWREYREGLEEFHREIADARQEISDGRQELADALIELEDGEREYADALPELEDARQELADGRQELDDGWVEYREGQAQYLYGLGEYEAGLAQYQAGLLQYEAGLAQAAQLRAQAAELEAALPQLEQLAQQYLLLGAMDRYQETMVTIGTYQASIPQLRAGAAQAEAQLAAAKLELDGAMAKLAVAKVELDGSLILLRQGEEELLDGEREYADGLAEFRDGQQELLDARRELDEGWADYNQGLLDLEEGEQTLIREQADGQRKLNDALADLRQGELDYADGLAEFRDGEQEAEEKLADAQKELEQARRDVEAIEECEWHLLPRAYNSGLAAFEMDADRMGGLASVFPLIFFLVAALVCLTTMQRLVEQQRVTIGGLKALGYSAGAISVKYVGYGLLSSLLGSGVGLILGLTLLPGVIYYAWGSAYALGPVVILFPLDTALLSCGAAVISVTLTAFLTCRSTLTAPPAKLMRPKAPAGGKRVLLEKAAFLWRRLSFRQKVVLRNLFRYQRRFWMTVAGIGGCTALIVTAFGLRDSILSPLERQYGQLSLYSAQVGLVDKVTPGELREVETVLADSGLTATWTLGRSERVTVCSPQYSIDAFLWVVPDAQALEGLVTLRHRESKTSVHLPEDGVVASEKTAALLGLAPGDLFTLEGEKTVEVRLADVTEHYLQHYLYMTEGYYRALFGQEPHPNQILARYPAQTQAGRELGARLVALDGVSVLSLTQSVQEVFFASLQGVDYAILIILVCAAALAFVVLYNLTNINISERARELATFKVLGFYDEEVSSYVSRENAILTAFGIVLGFFLGKALHQWLILTVEIDLLMFGRDLPPSCYLWAGLLTALFALLVNLVARRSLKKLDMIESLKSVE